MAPPSVSASHLLITASLPKPKPSSLRPPRLPLAKPVPAAAALLALAASPALAADAPAPAPAPIPAPAPAPELQAEAPTPTANPFSSSLLTAPKPSAASDLPEGAQWRYSEFLSAVKRGKVERVRFTKDGGLLQLTAVDGRRATVVVPNDPDLIDILATNGVDISVSEGESAGPGGFVAFVGNLLFPFLAFAGLFFLFRRAQGGPGAGPGGLGGPMDFGRSKSKFQEVPETGVTFLDVAGADQAKLELQEVVDFLKNPDKYTALGAKIPKGCLLVGPPGTGKTLLARAVAGEAGVPFFSCAASEVRDLFEKAKAKAPCIVFIDEIDAVGRQRGAGLGGGNDEREQTINQLLTEMDGFTGNSGVIVLAATNRPDVLDSALLRPGRFDRQVTVDRPDVAGRVKILEVHSRGKALAKDVDFEKIARRTLVSLAAILAARRDLKEISKDEISDALERIIAGPEKKKMLLFLRGRGGLSLTMAGHALVGALMPEYDPVAKISIIPRGQAGGLTFFAPSEERLESGLYSRSYLENQMAVALGGRCSFVKVLFVPAPLTVSIAHSDGLCHVSQDKWSKDLDSMSSQKDYSMATADVVDAEVRELVEKAYSRATQIITKHIDILHKLAQLLIEKETVDGEEFMSLFIDGQAELFVA
ncbi:unnamed protein product [Miscanthus lutarioriparius]|uniref:AAA+ ATPase domain-containing protein n=1 Tax=Miscanthus lutarioriparius TaxID=422564 RepID=A0A811SA66_9POAL|nr:unnamed protein product [Miscanthus lutarioriparius]